MYNIESNQNPVLSDGTILTKENHEQYDGAEGWQWYAAREMVDLKVTPTRWDSIKNWFSGIFNK